jgi:ABC-type sugar transport system substrate-binding protein
VTGSRRSSNELKEENHVHSDDDRSRQEARSRLTRRQALVKAGWGVGGLALPGVLAACGQSSSSAGGGAAAPGGVSLSVPKANLARARGVPKFVPPGPPFDASSAAGKTLYYHSITFDAEIIHTMYAGVTEAAELVGCKVAKYDAKGRPDLMIAGLEQAIAQRVDCILLESINNKLVDRQLKAVKDAGIKLVYINELYEAGPGRTEPDALVAFDYVGGSTLAADWVLADSGGRGINAAIFRADSERHRQQEKAIRERLTKYGAGDVKIRTEEVPFADFATRWPVLTRSVMTSDPNINYIFPVIDGISLYVVPALHQAGAAERVKIATFNGTESVLKMLAAGDVIAADTGGAQKWEGWLDVDRALRVLTGNRVEPGEAKPPNRLFDKNNINTIDLGAPEEKWYDTQAAKDGFKKLWGVA